MLRSRDARRPSLPILVYILTSRTGTLYVGVTGYLVLGSCSTRLTQSKDSPRNTKFTGLSISKLRIRPDRNSTRKTAQRLAEGKENCVDRKDESTVAGFGGKLGTRNAISGTVHSENSLNQHGKGRILGMFRRALALPLRGIRSALLNMTMWEDLSLNKKSGIVQRSAWIPLFRKQREGMSFLSAGFLRDFA